MFLIDAARRRAKAFLFDNECGGITVESVLWLPIYLGFFSLIADVSLLLHNRSNAMRIVHDTHRAATLGAYDSNIEVQNAIEARLASLSNRVSARTESLNGVMRTTVSIPANDLVAVGLVTNIANVDLGFAAFHLLES